MVLVPSVERPPCLLFSLISLPRRACVSPLMLALLRFLSYPIKFTSRGLLCKAIPRPLYDVNGSHLRVPHLKFSAGLRSRLGWHVV